MREWLMRMVAGREHAWWIHPRVEQEIAAFQNGPRGVLGCGAAIALVNALERSGADSAEFTLTNDVGQYVVTVLRREPPR